MQNFLEGFFRLFRNSSPPDAKDGLARSSLNARPAQASRGSLMSGGISNPRTGMGGAGDHSEHSFFRPTIVYWRHELEIIYVQSWACRKFIDIPVDDMTIKWRTWKTETGGEKATEAMQEAESRHQVQSRLSDAMKAGRHYGTSLMVMVTREAALEMPLRLESVREGDLISLPVFDRYSASVIKRDEDVYSETYGQPLIYRITPRHGQQFEVHGSRVLRFNGISPLTTDGWTIYEKNWGVSEIIPAMISILQDQTVATGAAHLSQEASIMTLKVDGLREALAGARRDPDEPSAEEIGEQISNLKSIYRLMMIGTTEEVARVAVSWAGLPDLIDKMARRLAAAAGIPATRFWGQSPIGLNATGTSDMANYAAHVAAMQKRLLTDPLERLDEVLARDAGIGEPPKYEWPDLQDASPTDQAETAKTKAEAVGLAIDKGVIDEDEGRAALDGDAIFGVLEGDAPGLPEPTLPPPLKGGSIVPPNKGGGSPGGPPGRR